MLTRDEILAEPAGARLDAWVCQHVLGWPFIDMATPFCSVKRAGVIVQGDDGSLRCLRFARIGDAVPCEDVHPSRDIAAAWLITAAKPGLCVEQWDDGRWCAYFCLSDGGTSRQDVADSAPLAIVRAALLVKLEERR